MSLNLESGITEISGDAVGSLVNIDVDEVDLFGGPVELNLPSHPPPPQELLLRVDEQRRQGACQKIAWSKQGTIASIGSDGRSVELRYLRAAPGTAEWGLCEPTQLTHFSAANVQSTFLGGPIVHIVWSSSNAYPELAVIDSVGRISIQSFTYLNRSYTMRSWEADPIDDLNAVVGCHWLPSVTPNKPAITLHGPATRENNAYRYESTSVPVMSPHHPNPNKSALLCVTASARLRLFFPQNNNVFLDTSVELENISSSDDLTTHASIAPETAQTVFIAMVTTARQLKIVRALIGWTPPNVDKSVPQQPLSPVLQHKHHACTNWLQRGDDESQIDIASAQVSHVEMLPATYHSNGQINSPPIVVTVRNYLPTGPGSPNGPSLEPQCFINRWELLSETPATALHPAFEHLGMRASPNYKPQPEARLNRLPTITLHNKTLISMQTLNAGRVLCFMFSDGTHQYRDRITFDEVFNQVDIAKVAAPQNAGLVFTDPTPCIASTLSPTNCSYVQLCGDGDVKWNPLKYTGPPLAATGPDPNAAAVVASLTCAVCTATPCQVAYDDVLAVARNVADRPRLAYDLIVDIIRVLKTSIDYTDQPHHDQLVRNNTLHTVFSILNHMGFNGEYKKRAFFSKLALLALNSRHIVILITIASNTPGSLKDKSNPMDEPDVVDALAGSAKWTLDLLAYLSDALFNLLNDTKFMKLLATGANFGGIINYLQGRNEIALHLLLCSSTRGYLSAACRRLHHLEVVSTKAATYYEHNLQQQRQAAISNGDSSGRAYDSAHSPPLMLSYQKLQHYISASLVNVQAFEALLAALGTEIKQIYQNNTRKIHQANLPASQQQQQFDAARRLQTQCELSLLVASNLPPIFQPMLLKFFNEDVRDFRAKTDPAKLYFSDFSLLEVEDDAHSLAERRAKGVQLDMFNRTELLPLRQLHGGAEPGEGNIATHNPHLIRRCVRCAAVMEDLTGSGSRPGYQFVVVQLRRCVCGGNWGLIPRA